MAEPTRVAVTGASGYIALHVIAALLDQGHEVRGTLRDMARAEEIRAALARRTEVSKLTFAQVDLTSDEGWDDAFAGCQYVQHVASPFPILKPKNQDDLIIPARDGALRALAAALRAGVQRVVLTSSVAAIGYGHAAKDNFTEDDWSVATPEIGAYPLSKTIAERAAWDYIAQLPEGQSLELVSINPSLVIGPLIDQNGSASIEIVRKYLAREAPGSPKYGTNLVDVRDVATAHIAAMTAPEAAGERYICNAEFRWLAQVAEQLNREFGPLGYPVPTRVLPNFLVRLVGVFDPVVRGIVPDLERRTDFDSAAIRRDLNWRSRSIDESVRATAESLIELGVV